MNIENMTKLRDHLQWLLENDRDYKFDMGNWLDHNTKTCAAGNVNDLRENLRLEGLPTTISPTECGTTACIAGHAALIGGADKDEFVYTFAAEWLGLDEEDAYELFMGHWSDDELDATLPEAIAHLTSLLESANASSPRN